MRILELALMAPVLAAASIYAATPASAAAPTPMPRPTIGGIKQPTCPQDGYITVTAQVQGGKTSVKIGDNVGVVVTVTAVSCDFVNVDIGMPMGGGLKGDGLNEIGFSFTAGQPYSFVVGAKAVQAGRWTYTTQVLGYSFGTTDPGPSSGCRAGAAGTVAGWICERSAMAGLTVTVSVPASPSPASSSGTSRSGSSGGPSSQTGGVGGAQDTTADEPVSPPPVEANGAPRAVGRLSAMSPPLLIGLALLAVAMLGLGALLIRRWIARPRPESPSVG